MTLDHLPYSHRPPGEAPPTVLGETLGEYERMRRGRNSIQRHRADEESQTSGSECERDDPPAVHRHLPTHGHALCDWPDGVKNGIGVQSRCIHQRRPTAHVFLQYCRRRHPATGGASEFGSEETAGRIETSSLRKEYNRN